MSLSVEGGGDKEDFVLTNLFPSTTRTMPLHRPVHRVITPDNVNRKRTSSNNTISVSPRRTCVQYINITDRKKKNIC